MVLCARRRRSGGGAPAEAVGSQALHGAECRVQNLGSDKIRNRPHSCLAGRTVGLPGGARQSLEGGSCSGMRLSWAGPGGLENGPGLNAADLQCVLHALRTLQFAVCSAKVRWPSGPRPEAVGCLDDSKRPPKKGPRTGSPARQGPRLAWSRGNGGQLQAITNQLSIIVQHSLWP